MSLSENISAKVKGKTGAGCAFSVDAMATGEWVFTGDYYDTPPYAWGSDHFYPGGNADYSYTCTQPDYSIDEASLPAYVALESVENIPATGSNPMGKRYNLSLSSSAPVTGSFSIPFSFETNCTMKTQGGNWTGVMMSVNPADSQPEACGKSQVIDLNPRGTTLKLPVTLGASCISPTPTPPPDCGDICNPSDNKCPIDCKACAKVGTENRCMAPSPTPTVTPPPSCGTTCIPSDNKCPQNCFVCVPTSGGKGICMAPSPTITPTPLPSCGTKCVVSNNLCPENCSLCVPTSGGFGTCMAPSPTPTPTPVPCNAPCSDSSRCDLSCAQCVQSTGGGSVCKAGCGAPCTNSEMCPLECAFCAPNPGGGGTICRLPASCNCDGITFEGTPGAGQTIKITAYVKVEDPDQNDAKALNMVFHVQANGQEIATSDPIAVSSPQRTTDQLGKVIDRYWASWDWTIPATASSGEVQYRIFVNENCGYKSVALLRVNQTKSVVLGTTDTTSSAPKTLLDRIFVFLNSLIRFRQGPVAPTPPPGYYPQFVFESTEGDYYTEEDLMTDSSRYDAIKLGEFNPFISPTPTPAVSRMCKDIFLKLWY